MVSRREIMKVLHFLIAAFVLLASTIILISGCEYDVAEPQWDVREFAMPQVNPVINSITPSEGIPGANTISIIGENLDEVPDSNILLDIPGTVVISPEIIEKTSTSITIRRPNLVTDSCYVKIWADSGIVVKYGPFKIDQVIEPYGSFLENQQLGGIDIDNEENIYVAVGLTPYPVVKVTPGGQRSTIRDTTSRTPTNLVAGQDGYLYLLSSNRVIERINIVTGELSSWHRLTDNRQLRVGALDQYGNFYAGGSRTDLYIISPDSTSRVSGMYQTSSSDGDTIISLKLYGGSLYVAAAGGSGRGIWKHTIDAAGNLGLKEVVLDLSTVPGFASIPISSFAVSSDNKIYIGANSQNSLYVYDHTNNSMDYFYKNIVPPYAKYLVWGQGNFLYMISGNLTPAQTWDCYRINMGTTGTQ